MLHCPITAPQALDFLDSETLAALLRGNFMGCSACGGSLALTPDQRVCVQYELILPGSGIEGLQLGLERLLSPADCSRHASRG